MNSAPLSTTAAASAGNATMAKALVLKLLQHLQFGTLIVEEGEQRYLFGQPPEAATVVGQLIVHNDSMYSDVLLRGSIGAGEAYMQGHWSSPDLTQLVRVMVQNMHLIDDMDGRVLSPRKVLTALTRWTLRAWHGLHANTRAGSRRNIAAHYDLGNDFYALFLDPTMMYSAAIFAATENALPGQNPTPPDRDALQAASLNKIDRICRKLQLAPGDHLLEIGTGWGGLAIHAAQHYGCRVTTTTISREQYDYACRQVQAAGLDDRITLLLQDYRDLDGRFNKLVSVEMIEAVGHKYYREYFEKCANLLTSDGLMLIQAITIPDQRFQAAAHSVDFIQRYIFPGGSLPSIEVIAATVARHTDLTISGIEEITQHYARTLRAWCERFLARLDRVRALGYDERFIRMWQFYLCYCEGGFIERSIGAHQFVFAKPGCRLEPVLGAL